MDSETLVAEVNIDSVTLIAEVNMDSDISCRG